MPDPARLRLMQSRRRWLKQAGVLASSTALPLWIPGSAAQSDSPLSTLPRTALVIGNTRYAHAPLRNPVNDAKAIGGELQKLGFKVDLLLDAGRTQMTNSIQAFGGALAKTKGVGLFYYAGHGAQLAWRNYLIPVDAEIDKLEDMRDKTVELNSVLQGLIKAANPMNVIILDACRDNPFGNRVLTEQKGLSQFDAPPGSLLAYATSPGNTAADGEGENGLYTENLLRELETPAAKIEDVFKRVRLAVRRRSEGRQIPWESTSLEEDFYFQPPKQSRKLSEAELEKQFQEELAGWEAVKDSKEPAPIEAYLHRFPSGKFSELAQFRLNRVLAKRETAVQVAAVGIALKPASGGNPDIAAIAGSANPFTKGTARADPNYKAGDRYRYRVVDLFTKLESREGRGGMVKQVTDTEVIYGNGRVTDLLGNMSKDPQGRTFVGNQIFIAEYSVGRRWTTIFRGTNLHDEENEWTLDLKVVGREAHTVPAGTFDAFKVQGSGYVRTKGFRVQMTYWVAPDRVRPFIAQEFTVQGQGGRYRKTDRVELVDFRQT